MAYTILQYGEKMQTIKKCNLRCAHTNNTKIRQNKQSQEFQILITYLNANDPKA
jgi:hypothetical protein